MTRYWELRKVNEGLCAFTQFGKLDIVVREIKGTGNEKSAKLEVLLEQYFNINSYTKRTISIDGIKINIDNTGQAEKRLTMISQTEFPIGYLDGFVSAGPGVMVAIKDEWSSGDDEVWLNVSYPDGADYHFSKRKYKKKFLGLQQ